MSPYFILLDGALYQDAISPALAACWKTRSFAPCRPLCDLLLPRLHALQGNFFAGPDEPLLTLVSRGLAFDRHVWRALVGEVLLIAAMEVPELQTAPDTWCCLLAPERYVEEQPARRDFAAIQQACHGSRDLVLGGAVYRPERVGINDRDDTIRLAHYLASIDEVRWTAADLASLREPTEEEERLEELEFAREWFPELRDLYRRAGERSQLVICEET